MIFLHFSDNEVVACLTDGVRFAASRMFPLRQRSALTVPGSNSVVHLPTDSVKLALSA